MHRLRAALHCLIRWYLRDVCGGGARDGVEQGGYLLWMSSKRYHNAAEFADVTDAEYVALRDQLYQMRGWVEDCDA